MAEEILDSALSRTITNVVVAVSMDELVTSIFIVLGCALLILLVGRKLHIPVLIGYFITGIIIGPYCLHLISEAQVSLLADLGVVLLMFTIGLEVPLKTLLSMKKIVLIGGTLQLVLTTAVVAGVMMVCGMNFNVSLFIGFLVAHSSTAIIMNLYQRSGEVDKPHGKIALGLLIFQDLNVVPMMLLVPFLSPAGGADVLGSGLKLVFGLLGLAVVLILAIYLVPKILRHIALTRSGELFVIAIVVIVLGIAVLMNFTGVELSLGAFLAGVAISGTQYSHEILGQVTPLRDLLTSFFFVSIGMMLNLQFIWQNLALILGLAAALLVFKTAVNFTSVKAIGIGSGVTLLSAVGLSQIGEFSFILGKTGLSSGILTEDIYQIFLSISIVTMAATTFLAKLAPKMTKKLFSSKVSERIEPDEKKVDHEVIVGYGLAGKYVVKALAKMGIDYVVLETNAETVTREYAKGVPIIFGDASREAILNYAGINKATSIVITVPAPDTVKAIVTAARRINPQITIITRSRFISDTAELYKLGADSVIVDERECAVQMFKRIMATKDMPVQDIDQLSKEMRGELYNLYIEKPALTHGKTAGEETTVLDSLKMRARQADETLSREMTHVQQLRVEPKCRVCGKMLSEIHLRKDYGISVLAVKHPDTVDADVSPAGTTVLKEGDTVVIIGGKASIAKILPLFVSNGAA